jgi:hypothetical protein
VARELVSAGTNIFLPYDYYRLIAVCSLPREQKHELRGQAELDHPNRSLLRDLIRSAVDAIASGLFQPLASLRCARFQRRLLNRNDYLAQ